MKKLLLTTITILTTLCVSAQFSAMATLNSVEDEAGETTYNFTDNLGVGYQVNESLMVGVAMDGEDNYDLVGRYAIKDALWATCIYNYDTNNEDELKDKYEGVAAKAAEFNELEESQRRRSKTIQDSGIDEALDYINMEEIRELLGN